MERAVWASGNIEAESSRFEQRQWTPVCGRSRAYVSQFLLCTYFLGNLPVSVYVIEPDTKHGPCIVHLNYDSLLKDSKPSKPKLELLDTVQHGSTVNLVGDI